MNTEINKTLDIDAILDQTLDDLADLPEWKPYPAGAHKVIMSFEKTTSEKKVPQIKVKMVALETLELASPAADTPLEKGAEVICILGMDNEFGQGLFKKIMGAFKVHLGMPDGVKNSEIMAAAQNMECIVITTVRENKEKTQKYTQIQEVDFA